MSTSTLNCEAMRSSTERRCSSPSARSTVSLRTGSCSSEIVGILGDHPVQHVGDPLLVAALFRRDRHALHRHREFERPHVDVVLVVRIVQHAVELDLVHLRHRGEVAGHGALDLDVLAALEQEEMPDLEWLPAVADEELRVAGHRTLVHAEDAELADERVDDHLEDVREDVLLRIRLGAELGGGLALALVEQRRIALGRVRHQLDHDLQQFGDADAVARARRSTPERDVPRATPSRTARAAVRARPPPARGTATSAPRRPRPPGRPAPGARPPPTKNRRRRRD